MKDLSALIPCWSSSINCQLIEWQCNEWEMSNVWRFRDKSWPLGQTNTDNKSLTSQCWTALFIQDYICRILTSVFDESVIFMSGVGGREVGGWMSWVQLHIEKANIFMLWMFVYVQYWVSPPKYSCADWEGFFGSFFITLFKQM